MLNLEEENQLIRKGTELGVLHEAKVIEIPEGIEPELENDEMESEDEVPKISRVRINTGSSRGRRKRHTMAVEAKPDEDGQINLCTDYRSCPLSNKVSEVPRIYHLNRPPENEENNTVDEHYDVYEESDEVENGLVDASEAMDTLDLDEVLLLEELVEETDGNADGLSRRPPPDKETSEEVRTIRKETKKNDSSILVGENLPLLQQQDPELGRFVKFRVRSEEPPSHKELQVESELTKKCVTKWNRLCVREDLVYLRDKATKKGEPPVLQLLLPRSEIDNALRLCHTGTVGGHFGFRKTIDQVRRRFYWSDWKEDMKRFCRRCDECTKYHRGKLAKQGPLKPVLPGAPTKDGISILLDLIRSPKEETFGYLPVWIHSRNGPKHFLIVTEKLRQLQKSS